MINRVPTVAWQEPSSNLIHYNTLKLKVSSAEQIMLHYTPGNIIYWTVHLQISIWW